MATVSIKTANDLKHICDTSFPEVFIPNIGNIYAHTDKDIYSILDSKSKTIIKDLWIKLISWLQEQYEPCKNRSPLTCKSKKTEIIPEINLICRFLTASTDNKPKLDLNCFFFPQEEQPMNFTDEAVLIKCVRQMKAELDSMKNIKSEFDSLKLEVRENKDHCRILKVENVQLRSQLRSCIATIDKFNQNELTHESLHESINSVTNDSDNESVVSSVSDQESIISESPIAKKKKKSIKQNQVRAAPVYSSAFIGNVHTDITTQDLREWISDEHNIAVNISDIVKLNTVGKSNAFKISVPKEKLQQTITGWPNGIKAEPFSLKKPKIYAANTTRGSQSSKDKNRNHRFRNPQNNAFKPNPWARSKNPHWQAPNHSNWTDQYSFRPNGNF